MWMLIAAIAVLFVGISAVFAVMLIDEIGDLGETNPCRNTEEEGEED